MVRWPPRAPQAPAEGGSAVSRTARRAPPAARSPGVLQAERPPTVRATAAIAKNFFMEFLLCPERQEKTYPHVNGA
jgi:hypothetical protein